MCSRIAKAFQKKQLFIGYLTAGEGDSLQKFRMLLDGGVDLLEIGIPFSDPIADGPVIQKAMQRSLYAKTTLDTVFQLVRDLRKESLAPIVLFTYYNPIQKDLSSFLENAKSAGADGILVIDLPLEAASEYRRLCLKCQLDPIFVIAPSTSKERIAAIGKMGKGFLYYACQKGTTGARSSLPDNLAEKIALIRTISDLPIAVGFGIADRQAAKRALEVADAFVVGSCLVEHPEKVYDFRS
jgi:tryptophan synthase alpha chain